MTPHLDSRQYSHFKYLYHQCVKTRFKPTRG